MKLRSREYQSGPAKQPAHTVFEVPALDTFHIFPRLPVEIRQEIWRVSLQPRIVEIRYAPEENCFYSTAKLPPSLVTCSESRAVTLPLYPARFGSTFNYHTVRFKHALDTLYLDDAIEQSIFHFLDNLQPHDISHITSLAISGQCFDVGHPPELYPVYWAKIRECLPQLPKLKEFLVVKDLGFIVEDADVAADMFWDYSEAMQLYEDILDEIINDPRELLLEEFPHKHHCPTSHWCDPKVRIVWGWRRPS